MASEAKPSRLSRRRKPLVWMASRHAALAVAMTDAAIPAQDIKRMAAAIADCDGDAAACAAPDSTMARRPLGAAPRFKPQSPPCPAGLRRKIFCGLCFLNF